jgi:hypothetical protein
VAARADTKAARAPAHKAAGLALQKTKTKVQVQSDRKARKELQATNKVAKAAKAKAKPNYKSHEQKIKDKATVVFSSGASKRLDALGLHGKDRKSAKKFHKNIMKSEMKKNGATKGVVVYVLCAPYCILLIASASITALPLTQGELSKKKRITSRHSSSRVTRGVALTRGPYLAAGQIRRLARSRSARSTSIMFTSMTSRKYLPLGQRP